MATSAHPAPEAATGHWLDSWHVNPSLNKDYDVIDGLRGIAILLVVACHLVYVNPNAGPLVKFLGGIAGAGAWGVTVFFTLSGFLIAHPFWRRKISGSASVVPKGYGWRRFWKIYPPLALSVVVLTPIYILRSHDPAYLDTAAMWLAGLPILLPVRGHLNPVMWSLIVEVHFYILLPLLFLALRRVPPKTCLWLLLFGFIVIPTIVRWWHLAHGVTVNLHPRINTHFPSVLDSFAFGVFIAGLENLRLVRRSWAKFGDIGCILLVVTFVLSSWLSLHPLLPEKIQTEALTWLVKIAAGLMLCYIADPSHPRSRLFSAPVLRWCGVISYEWYLFHQPIILWARESFGPAGGNVLKYGAVVGGSFVVGLLIAATVYRWFSLPILKFGRNRNVAL